ncbi:MAG TPA: hypothetical protein VKZ77_04960 [Bacillaceae bacterium]|nr:hypothetical protein [Bacillaceae bacterium]
MNLKKSSIIGISALAGVLAIGGTAFAFNQQNETELKHAKQEIKSEITNIDSIQSQLSKFEDEDGYLSPSLTMDKLNQYEKSLNSMKDSHVDFNIKKDKLNNEIEVVRIGKQDALTKLESIKTRIEVQNEVNALFVDKAIRGTEVSTQPITKDTTKDKVTEVQNKLDSLTDGVNTEWHTKLVELVENALNQVEQIDKAQALVTALIDGDAIKEGVSRDEHATAQTEVDKIVNEDIKKEQEVKLNKVLDNIVAREKAEKAEQERIAQEQKQAEEKAKQEQVAKQQAEQKKTSTNTQSTKPKTSTSTQGKPKTNTKPKQKEQLVNGKKSGEGNVKGTDGHTWESWDYEVDNGKLKQPKNIKITDGGNIVEGLDGWTWDGGTFEME